MSPYESKMMLALLRATIEGTADGILVVEPSGRIVLGNEQFRTMWGLPPGACDPEDLDCLIGLVSAQLDDPAQFMDPIRTLRAEPAAASFDVLFFRDGRVYERYSRPQVVDGQTMGRVWTFRNVSRRRRAEREALDSQRRFDSVSKATNDAVYDWDITADTMWWNGNFRSLFGYTVQPGDCTLAWFMALVHHADRVRLEQSLDAALAGTASTWMAEYRLRRADGAYAVVFERGYIERDEAGTPVRMIGALMDISARKRSEERLEQLAAILETTTDYVGTADVNGRLQYLNRAARRLVGLSDDADITSLTLSDFHAGWATNAVVREGMKTALATGSWNGESVIQARDGRDVPVSHVILAHRDPRGEVAYLSTIARDMSGERLLQRQLLQSQKMEAIGQLAGGIAHDFNNLLTVIKAHCEFLTEDIIPGHPLRPDIEAVATAGERASALTRQLLAFSRQQFLKPVALDLNAVVRGVEPMLRRLIGEDIVFTTVCRDGLGVVQADPRQLEQVLLNLMVNARDAMPRGGSLTISTGIAHLSETDPRVTDRSLESGNYAVLSVSDTGTGMSPTVRERIFDPFFTTKEQGKGTGLGLSTVYGIIKQSGGHVVVYSEPGQGSTFKVFLPRSEGAAEPSVPVAVPEPAKGSGIVLLVEDEASLRDAARRGLERAGYTVRTAFDGRDALRVANEIGPVDLLLTDVVMPHLGGRELAELLRLERPGLAVLFMSGYTDDDILRRGMLARDAAFLEKPFTPHALAAAARAALEASRKAQ